MLCLAVISVSISSKFYRKVLLKEEQHRAEANKSKVKVETNVTELPAILAYYQCIHKQTLLKNLTRTGNDIEDDLSEEDIELPTSRKTTMIPCSRKDLDFSQLDPVDETPEDLPLAGGSIERTSQTPIKRRNSWSAGERSSKTRASKTTDTSNEGNQNSSLAELLEPDEYNHYKNLMVLNPDLINHPETEHKNKKLQKLRKIKPTKLKSTQNHTESKCDPCQQLQKIKPIPVSKLKLKQKGRHFIS